MSTYLVSTVWHYKLDKTTAFILMALCDSAEDDGTRCFPSIPYLVWKTSCGKSTIYRTIESLTEKGVLIPVGMIGDTVEYEIHLEKLTTKTSWERRRKGRPRKSSDGDKIVPQRENIPTVGNISQGGKNRPTVGKSVPQREKFSQGGNSEHVQQRPPRRKKSGPKAGGDVADPYLYTQSYKPKLIDSAHLSTNQDEKKEGASPPHHPDVAPIAEIRRNVGDTPSPPVAPAPLSPAPSTWRVIRAEMEPSLSPVQRREWLDRLEFFHIEGDEWAIVAPTKFAAEFAENRWGGHFRAALQHAAGPDATLLFVSAPSTKGK